MRTCDNDADTHLTASGSSPPSKQRALAQLERNRDDEAARITAKTPTDAWGLRRLYQRLNRQHFDGALPADTIVLRGLPHDAAPEMNGITRWLTFGVIHFCEAIYLDEWLWTAPEPQRSEMIEQTLLHEMVHPVAGPVDNHGPKFVAECNRIAERNGWIAIYEDVEDDWPDEDCGPTGWPLNAIVDDEVAL